MRRFVFLQRSTARLVILVMLAAALFPTLGHAFAADKAGSFGWMEVCTAGGIEVRSVAVEDQSPAKPSLLVEHCPYCLVSSADDAFLPISVPAFFAAPEGAVLRAGKILQGESFALRTAALPRAPPLVL